MNECDICCETYNLKNHQKKQCTYCEFTCCHKCIQMYLLNSTIDPHCMKCRRAWDQEIFETMVNKSFRNNDYKKHREVTLFDREKSLLPDTQQHAQRELEIRHYINVNRSLWDTYREYNKKILEYKRQKNDIRIRNIFNNEKTEMQLRIDKKKLLINKIEAINQEKEKTYRLINDNTRIIHRLRRGENTTNDVKVKRTFTIRCSNSGCKGFVGGDNWCCGLCQYYSCSHCHELIGESKDITHECKPENIETAKMLKKEARSCPGCSTLIYRISGCAQMWCTQCHTVFNWNTGELESGVVHNPHYYEYQRNHPTVQPRNHGDVACGGLIRLNDLYYYLGTLKGSTIDKTIIETIPKIHRICNHVHAIDMRRYRVQFFVNDNLQLRVQYLINDIDEQQFKHKLQRNEKDKNKRRDIYMILEMFFHTMCDLFRNLLENKDSEFVEDWFNQVKQLYNYTNNYLEKVSKRYSCVVPILSIMGEHNTIKYH